MARPRLGHSILVSAAVASTALFGGLVGLWFYGQSINPNRDSISLSRAFHVTIDAGRGDTRLVFFNDISFGPYSGGIISVTSSNPNDARHPDDPTMRGFGDSLGIYYRRIRWPSGPIVWTLSLHLLYALAAAAVLPATLLTCFFRRRRRRFVVELYPQE